jgi:hypothetical protein
MHRYPLEIAVVAQHVDGLANGAYRYVPAKHSLEEPRSAHVDVALRVGNDRKTAEVVKSIAQPSQA